MAMLEFFVGYWSYHKNSPLDYLGEKISRPARNSIPQGYKLLLQDT